MNVVNPFSPIEVTIPPAPEEVVLRRRSMLQAEQMVRGLGLTWMTLAAQPLVWDFVTDAKGGLTLWLAQGVLSAMALAVGASLYLLLPVARPVAAAAAAFGILTISGALGLTLLPLSSSPVREVLSTSAARMRTLTPTLDEERPPDRTRYGWMAVVWAPCAWTAFTHTAFGAWLTS